MTRFESRRRVAVGLWIVWAVVVWNVVFDHTIEIAGRAYLRAAAMAAQAGGPYARIDDWMRPAAASGLWIATASAAGILAVGLVGVRVASAGSRRNAKRRLHSEVAG
ncbi:MAG: hypothetical protein ABJA98_16715 [Acidobacteriota bacterium]